MRHTRTLALFGVTILIAACGSDSGAGSSASSANLETDEQKVSYGLGRNLAETLGDRLDIDVMLQGIEDGRADREAPIPDSAMQSAMMRVAQAVDQDKQTELQAQGESNRQAGDDFLAENGQKEGVTTTESGLQYEVLEAGDGAKPVAGDQVTIHYRGTLLDGTVFDSSYDRGQPATFGVTGVIQGFSEGLQLMSVGSKYKFYIPGDLAYGPNGNPPTIPPNATLVFEVELLGVE